MSQGGQNAGNERSMSERVAADFGPVGCVVLFFWGNSKVALERHAQKKQERISYVEDWRAKIR